MDLTKLKKLKTTIDKQQTSLNALLQEKERCLAGVNAGTNRSAEIAALNQQRGNILGQAYLDGVTADTADLDRQIDALMQDSAKAMQDAEAATAALPIIDSKISDATAQLDKLQAELRAEAQDAISQEFSIAEDDYDNAVTALKEALARMLACGSVLTRMGRYAISSPEQAIADSLHSNLRTKGLYSKQSFNGQPASYFVDADIYGSKLFRSNPHAFDLVESLRGVGLA